MANADTWTDITLPYSSFVANGKYLVTAIGDLSSARPFTVTVDNVTLDVNNTLISFLSDIEQCAQISGNNFQLWNASITANGTNNNGIGLWFLGSPTMNVTLLNVTAYDMPYFSVGDITGLTINACHFTNFTDPFAGTILSANLQNTIVRNMPYGFGFSGTDNSYVGNVNSDGTLIFDHANNTLIENCIVAAGGIAVGYSVNTTVQDMYFNNMTVTGGSIGAGHSTNFVMRNIVANDSYLVMNYGTNVTADHVESDNVTGTNGISCESNNGLNVTNSIFENDGWAGIHADGSTNVFIHNNTIIDSKYGMTLHGGDNAVYDNNTVIDCQNNFHCMDYYGTEWPFNIVVSNNRGYGGVGALWTTVAMTDFDNISNMSIYNNDFQGVTGSAFHGTNLTNPLFYNNLINGTYDFVSTTSGNFNTTKQTGTRIYGNGSLVGGNFWANSTHTGYSEIGTDNNNDGFVDSPYSVVGSLYDYLPLSLNYTTLSNPSLTITTGTGIHTVTARVFVTVNAVNTSGLSLDAVEQWAARNEFLVIISILALACLCALALVFRRRR